ncbi:malonyl-ACP O-methyltransferase BioC [Longirhabdus pacifica]|uniref:malonyl-ACP O-methyltransferase BioC n=1 Tax=Longirhabdus pacifica TaxID=2305227 RepID=UPI00100904A1|nr:malonyl-ACP O-methyltransferase BioC [Longirhabdus pacifica]
MVVNKHQVRLHFDKNAYQYEQYASLQEQMAQRLVHTVLSQRDATQIHHILEIGSGTGLLTRKLLQYFPHAIITAIDISSHMIEQAQASLSKAQRARVHFICEDAEHMESIQNQWSTLDPHHDNVDLIISNASFQWFNEPKKTIGRYIHQFLDQGLFAFSTFGPRTFHEMHHAFEVAEQIEGRNAQRRGQPFVSLPYWDEVMTAHHGVKLALHTREEKQYFKSVLDFLRSIQRIGASSANSSSQQAYLSKALLKSMTAQYESLYTTSHGIEATYEIIEGCYAIG